MEYRIEGSDLQFVQMTLSPGDSAIGEPGSMMYLDEGLSMETRLGDGIDESVMSRIIGAFKRSFTGESMFTSLYTNTTQQALRLAFAAPSPGKIMAVDLTAHGGSIICQKGAFLGGTRGVRVGLAFKKRLRVGFFGGEGFIMQRITGNGVAFIHASGALTAIQLAPGQALEVDTGCLAAMQTSASYDIKYVGKLKTSFFGGEGMFHAFLKGPGTVWLQSLPMRRLSKSILSGSMRQQGGISGRLLYFAIIIIGVILTLSGEGSN
jgi:uncharacterized protein (TIGR00266 family)